jgi:hypothetical protein
MEGGRATGDINNMEAASAAFSFAPAVGDIRDPPRLIL